MAYIVRSALVVARDTDGKHVYLYKGAEVPANIAETEVARLADEGFLVAVEPVVLEVTVPVVVNTPVADDEPAIPADDEPRRTRRARPAGDAEA